MLMTRLKVIALIASMVTATAGLTAVTLLAATKPESPPATHKAASPIAREDKAAEAIMRRMKETYAAAKSYEDEGESLTVFRSATVKHRQLLPFSTRFVRPNLYRYEFTEQKSGDLDRYVIWGDAIPDRAKTWWTLRPETKEMTLGMAVGAAVGVSSYSSQTIPQLLMPDVFPSAPFVGLKGVKLVGVESVDESPCDKIEGTNIRGDVMVVWIDKATFLVRKTSLSSELKDKGLLIDQTTTYHPRLNPEIAPDQLEFVPPKP